MKILILELNYSAGTETVVKHLLRSFPKNGVGVVLLTSTARIPIYSKAAFGSDVTFESNDWPATGWRRGVRFLANRRFSRLLGKTIGRALNNLRVRDIISRHDVSHVFAPWIFDVPMPDVTYPSLAVMTMDLAWHHFPDAFSATKAELDRRFEIWLKRADVIFPVSDSAKDELVASFPRYSAKTISVPHGAQLLKTLRAGTKRSKYFFCPASVTANKNHITLLKAACILYKAGHDFQVVLTGKDTHLITSGNSAGPQSLSELQAFVKENEALFAGRLECMGFTSEEVIEDLYANAIRVVLPSLYEGFGLPALEAFERCAAIICSGIPPFREQIKRYGMEDRATVVDPISPETLAVAMGDSLYMSKSPKPTELEYSAKLARWSWDDVSAAYLRELNRF